MMKKILAAAFVFIACTAAYAQNSGTVANHAFAIGKGPNVTGFTSLLCGSGQLAIGSATDPVCRTVSGDATLSAAGVLTLATVNANVGTFGSATQCVTTTQNAKGLTTAVSAATCTPGVASVTGLGTGVATALGVNVGTAGSFVVNGGALGTPSSGVATNLTGTAASLTAGHVTTNANLTGDVTSVGNATTAVKVNGVSYSASPSTDTVPVVTAANTTTYTALSNCNTGIYLQYNTSTHLFTCGTLPYFSAYPSVASTTVTTSVSTKMAINTKVSDSNVWYDAATNFRFTPLLAGKYNVHVQVTCNGTTVSACVGQIYKNGANYAQQQINGSAATQGANANTIITFNGTTDFVEAFVLVVCTGTCGYTGGTAPEQTLFEANYIGP